MTAQITAILEEDGWRTPYNWPSVTNVRTDEYGNTVRIHDQGETILIEFEYALGSVVETMHLDPLSGLFGAHRIAAVIAALAAPPQ